MTAIQTLSAALTQADIENRVERFDHESEEDDLIIVVSPGREIIIQTGSHGCVSIEEWIPSSETMKFIDSAMHPPIAKTVALVQRTIAAAGT